MLQLWHYTTGQRLPQILVAGLIRPSFDKTVETNHYLPHVQDRIDKTGETGLVWCSTNPFWERSAAKGAIAIDHRSGRRMYIEHLTMEQHAQFAQGIARIEVTLESAPYNFRQACQVAHTPREIEQHLFDKGLQIGADPSEWFATPTAIPSGNWLGVDVFHYEQNNWVQFLGAGRDLRYDESLPWCDACQSYHHKWNLRCYKLADNSAVRRIS